MELSAYLFAITPPADAGEDFEQSLAASLQELAHGFTHRAVSGTSQTLFRGRDEKEAVRYVWRLQLGMVSGKAPIKSVAFTGLVADLGKLIGPKGTVAFISTVDSLAKGKAKPAESRA
jgi:hypothetical protein